MIPEQLSRETLSLLRGAREDGPPLASRQRMWTQVSATTATAAVLATSAKAAAAVTKTGLGLSKAGLLTTMFGAAVTVGSAVAVLHATGALHTHGGFSSGPIAAMASAAPRVQANAPALEARLSEEAPPGPEAAVAEPLAAAAARANARADIPATAPRMVPAVAMNSGVTSAGITNPGAEPHRPMVSLVHGSHREEPARASGRHPFIGDGPSVPGDSPSVADEDRLLAEAALLEQARQEVSRGDGAAALASLRTAHNLGANKLVPESLALEVRALHLLGRNDEAALREAELRSRFPNEALVR